MVPEDNITNNDRSRYNNSIDVLFSQTDNIMFLLARFRGALTDVTRIGPSHAPNRPPNRSSFLDLVHFANDDLTHAECTLTVHGLEFASQHTTTTCIRRISQPRT